MFPGVFQNHHTDVNKTCITLIPEKEEVIFMKDFRPISLCNVGVQDITRLLSLRIRPFMSRLVGPCQSGFVPSRQSGDNIIVVQEIFHSMRSKTGRKGWMVIKIDLEKAYDRLILLSRHGSPISHLAFAYVFILLTEASLEKLLASHLVHDIKWSSLFGF